MPTIDSSYEEERAHIQGNKEVDDSTVTKPQTLREHALAEQQTLNNARESSLAANSAFRDAQNVQNWLGNIRVSCRPWGGDVCTAM